MRRNKDGSIDRRYKGADEAIAREEAEAKLVEEIKNGLPQDKLQQRAHDLGYIGDVRWLFLDHAPEDN